MMRRCILEFSSSRSLRRVITQSPYFLSSRKEFSVSARQNVSQKPPGSAGKPPESGDSHVAKFVVGGVLIGGAVAAAAYKNGYFGQDNVKQESVNSESVNNVSKDIDDLGEKVVVSNNHVEKNGEDGSDSGRISEPNKMEGESQVEDKLNVSVEEDAGKVPVQQNDLPSVPQSSISFDDQSSHSKTSSVDVIDKKEDGVGLTDAKGGGEQNGVVNDAPISQEMKEISEENEIEAPSAHHHTSEDTPKALLVNEEEPPTSLLDAYFLGEDDGGRNGNSLDEKVDGSIPHPKEKEKDSVGVSEEWKDVYISKDGKLVLDFLQAIHAAEERQAELDARILAEEKRMLKEKFEKELKDARARELMYAEEAAMLEKELNKERAKAAATVKLLQEKAEENLKKELEHKANEAEMQLKKVQELAQAELAAAIASEKASQIEKMAEANLHINALCMAFYARSEEARQSHSVHKLALGALALEDALSKGLPIQTEISVLHTCLEGIDKDSLLHLVLSSLPEETLNYGTETQLQLSQKFDALKGTLRHYSLIPPSGGGILAHTLAHVASWLKMREDDLSGDGIESIISRVDSFLAEGKLVEAADALEGGVSGSQAEEVIGEWVRRARNRAITEQALSLLQSYATSISVT